MSIVLRFFIGVISLLLLCTVLRDLVKRKLTEMQSLFWIFMSLGILVVAIFPDSVFFISTVFHVEYAPSIWFALAITMALFGIYSCYRTNADLLRRVNELSIQISLLNDQARRAEEEASGAQDKKE